jgi:hypothetical protein
MALAPGPLSGAPWIKNPFGVDAEPTLELLTNVGNFLAIPVFLMGLASFLLRARRAGPVERQQLKWFGFTSAVAVTALLLSLVSAGRLSDFFWMIALVSIGVLPIAIGVAILRYRLWDIDRIVSRTIAYAVLTILLAALFGLSVVVLEGALASVTAGDTIVVAVSTLAVASAFQPLRRRVQRVVDRRFDRSTVDHAALAAAFGGRLRDQVDLDAVIAELTRAVQAGTAPTTAAVWIPERGSR